MMRHLLLAFCVALLPLHAWAELGAGLTRGDLAVPASRLSDWTKAGVIGGIPDTSDVTKWPVIDTDTDTVGSCVRFTAAEKTGAIDASAKLRCYLNYAYLQSNVGGRSGTVVKLGAGTFFIEKNNATPVQIKSNTVLRGSGSAWSNTTTIVGAPSAGNGDYAGGVLNGVRAILHVAGAPSSVALVTDASLPAGTATFTVDTPSYFSVGSYVFVQVTNNPAYGDHYCEAGVAGALCSADNWVRPKTTYGRVTAKNGNQITIDHPLVLEYGTNRTNDDPKMTLMLPSVNAGIENLTVMLKAGDATYYKGILVSFNESLNCWIKDSVLRNGGGYFLQIFYGSHLSVLSNLFDYSQYMTYDPEGNTNNTVINTGVGASFIDISNNVFNQVENSVSFQSGMNSSRYTYNYLTNPHARDPHGNGLMFHGTYPFNNLAEGNDSVLKIQIDSYWGRNGPGNTAYRNRLRSDINTESWPDSIFENNRYVDAYRTSMGFTAINNSAYAWVGTPFCGYTAGSCRSYLEEVYNGWLERNLYRDPSATGNANNRGYWNDSPAIDASNHVDNVTKATSPPGAWSGFSFPASFAYTSKPSWWCNETPWPAIGANVDDYTNNPTNLTKLPAQRRYEGLTCTVTGASGLGVPGRPALIP